MENPVTVLQCCARASFLARSVVESRMLVILLQETTSGGARIVGKVSLVTRLTRTT